MYSIDQRGFGRSGGRRVLIENAKQVYDDQWLLIFEVLKKCNVNQQTTPLFLSGRSNGALIATNMAGSFLGQKLFRAVSLLTPFYHLYNTDSYKLLWKIKLVHKVAPHFEIHVPTTEYSEEFKQKWKWYYSFNMSYDQVTPTYVLTAMEMQEQALSDMGSIKVPVLMAEADEDKVVCGE